MNYLSTELIAMLH